MTPPAMTGGLALCHDVSSPLGFEYTSCRFLSWSVYMMSMPPSDMASKPPRYLVAGTVAAGVE